MTAKQAHPMGRTKLMQELDKLLYTKTLRRHRQEELDLIKENCRLCKTAHPGFTYKGQVYLRQGAVIKPGGPLISLDADLRDRMNTHLEKVKKFTAEKSKVEGYFLRIMLESCYTQDLYALLPEHLHAALRATDRFFLSGDGILSSQYIAEFKEANHQYLTLVKARLAYNLLDVGQI